MSRQLKIASLAVGVVAVLIVCMRYWVSEDESDLSGASNVATTETASNQQNWPTYFEKRCSSGLLENSVTLVTQASTDKLSYLKLLLDRWNGPVSLAVFAVSTDDFQRIVEFLTMADDCFKIKLLCQTSLQIYTATKKESVANSNALKMLKALWYAEEIIDNGDNINCFALDSELSSIVDSGVKPSFSHPLPYPANYLRNLALSNVHTKYVIVFDIDVIPSFNLHLQFADFLTGFDDSAGKIAFVVPVFEVKIESDSRILDIPKTKPELLEMIKSGDARPFYSSINARVQHLTNYPKWYRLPYSANRISAAYAIDWQDPFEPFYLAAMDGLSKYDERFQQYGVNRLSQICEAYVAGWDFVVLDNAFAIHLGFKEPSDFHAMKQQELAANQRLYDQLKLELLDKYPNNGRVC